VGPLPGLIFAARSVAGEALPAPADGDPRFPIDFDPSFDGVPGMFHMTHD